MSAIWANQVNEISSARKCQTQVFPVGMTRFSLCQAAHLSLPGSWQVISSRRKTLWGLPRAPNLQSSVSVYVSKMEVKLTWKPGLTACHMLQGGRFASHGCEKPHKNLTGNQDFRTVIKSVYIQIIERAKFQRGIFRLMLIQHDNWVLTSQFEKKIVKMGKFSIELSPSNVRDCPACTLLILVSLHLTPVSATSVVFYHWIIKSLIWIHCK